MLKHSLNQLPAITVDRQVERFGVRAWEDVSA